MSERLPQAARYGGVTLPAPGSRAAECLRGRSEGGAFSFTLRSGRADPCYLAPLPCAPGPAPGVSFSWAPQGVGAWRFGVNGRCLARERGALPSSVQPTPHLALASMGPTQKPNVCRQLSRRALGFFSRDAGVVQRTNLGILRVLVCQVIAGGWEWGQGQGATGGQASSRGAVFLH